MSPAMSALSSIGITHNLIVIGILFIVVAAVIGMYWHIILPGTLFLAVAILFVDPQPQPVQEQAKAVTPVEVKPEVKEFDEYEAYMQDCTEVAEYSKSKCEKLWAQRGNDEVEDEVENTTQDVAFKPASGVKLLNVSNKEYIQRRDKALKKPNAVVAQVTYH